MVDQSRVDPRIWFQAMSEPKSVKNRLHLDLEVSGGRALPLTARRQRVNEEVSRPITAGARILHMHTEPSADHYAVTLADPEDNEFCVN